MSDLVTKPHHPRFIHVNTIPACDRQTDTDHARQIITSTMNNCWQQASVWPERECSQCRAQIWYNQHSRHHTAVTSRALYHTYTDNNQHSRHHTAVTSRALYHTHTRTTTNTPDITRLWPAELCTTHIHGRQPTLRTSHGCDQPSSVPHTYTDDNQHSGHHTAVTSRALYTHIHRQQPDNQHSGHHTAVTSRALYIYKVISVDLLATVTTLCDITPLSLTKNHLWCSIMTRRHDCAMMFMIKCRWSKVYQSNFRRLYSPEICFLQMTQHVHVYTALLMTLSHTIYSYNRAHLLQLTNDSRLWYLCTYIILNFN